MLTLLLGLEVKTRETTKILLDNGLVDRGAAADTLAIVVGDADGTQCQKTMNEARMVQRRTKSTNRLCS